MKKLMLMIMVSCGLAGMFLLAACGGSGGGGGGGGSHPKPFNTSCFPLDIPDTDGGWSNIAFDGDGNLIIPDNGSNEVLSVDRLTCTLSTLASVSTGGGQLYSIVYHPDSDEIYVGDTAGNIYAVNPSSGASTLLVNLSDYINVLAVAPAGYGSFGGQLLAGTASGEMVAVNTANAATTVAADIGGVLSDMEFGANGTLYGVDNVGRDIITISADGMTSVLASGFSSPDGIAVDEEGDRLFVADSSFNTLYAVQIADGAKTNLGPYTFNSGYYPSGLAYDGVQTLLMGTGQPYLTIQALTFGEQLLTNGGFESGDLSGWTYSALNGAATAGSIWVIDSETAPSNGSSLAGPSKGTYYAVSAQGGPSTGALIQEFTVPTDANTVTLTFDMFVLDLDGGPINAGALSHNLGTANQHARVDILTDAAGAFDTGGTVVRNLYLDVDGYSPILPYISYFFDLSDDLKAGETYKLRFAFTVTEAPINMGMDDVSIIAK